MTSTDGNEYQQFRRGDTVILNRLKFEIARAKAQLPIQELCKKARCNPRCFTGNKAISVPVLTAGRIAMTLGVELETLLDENQEG